MRYRKRNIGKKIQKKLEVRKPKVKFKRRNKWSSLEKFCPAVCLSPKFALTKKIFNQIYVPDLVV